jgi:uncharacterized protein YjbI with pentapeptide repeats
MANPEHLRILMLYRDVKVWNAWRDENRDITLDLSGANLREANLHWADLSGAILYHASLSQADLRRADLTRANLGGANLGEANLRWANLTRANLGEAYLCVANLTRANLGEADFSRAVIGETVFGETDLTAVQGLETCLHEGPSTLDHSTLARSGPFPLAFLRGCGLNDWEIEATKLYDQRLTSSQVTDILYRIHHLRTDASIQFHSCFISYASKDHAFAERLYADLQNKGVRCWFAPEDMKIGDRLRPRIDETIRLYDKLLLVLSRTSVASQWVEQEVETALARERQQGTTILFPVRIDNTVMTLETGWPALIRNTRNIGDFRRWKTHDVYQKAFDRLLRDLKAAERKPEGSRPVG